MDAKAPELIIRRAKLWTDGGILPAADALAIRDGHITAIGPTPEIERLSGSGTRVLDAGGATVTPGLCDAHVHLLRWAHSLGRLSLRGCGSRAEALERVRRHVAENPGVPVIVGRGWDSNGWPEPPDRDSLDAIVPETPALLWAHDDHSLWVNSAALREAGVTDQSDDPAGGRFQRRADGRLDGIVREHAVRVFSEIERRVPMRSDAEVLHEAVRTLHGLGITAVHDFENAHAMRALRAMTRTDVHVRVLMHLTHKGLDDALTTGIESGVGDDLFRVGGVKLFADGTLGSRTAAMLEPYDGTSETGMDLIGAAEMRETVGRAVRGGLSVAVHAIGDRASRSALDAFAACRGELPGLSIPPRIEHVQILDASDVARFADLGVVASMQPQHCVTDIETARRFWHSRAALTYPWRTLLNAGASLVFGSDAPIEPPDPALGLHAAMTRQRPDGWPEGGYVPAERVSLDEALSAYTAGPARLEGRWPRGGRLASGAHGDVVIWEDDLHALPVAELARARPHATLCEGRVVFERLGDSSSAAGAGRRATVGAEGR